MFLIWPCNLFSFVTWSSHKCTDSLIFASRSLARSWIPPCVTFPSYRGLKRTCCKAFAKSVGLCSERMASFNCPQLALKSQLLFSHQKSRFWVRRFAWASEKVKMMRAQVDNCEELGREHDKEALFEQVAPSVIEHDSMPLIFSAPIIIISKKEQIL